MRALKDKSLYEEANEIKTQLIADRRYIHAHAETGDNLPVTARYIKDRLMEMGYEPCEICKCGVTAVAGGRKTGKTFLLRADMDALSMREESGLPFASQNTGRAHTCGHDLHTAMLLGAGALLKAHEDEIEGTVKLMFQPDEEGLTGADAMIRAGILENPTVDAAMAFHVIPGDLPPGVAAVRAGAVMASSDHFRITVRGRGGHGAHPDTAVDPINVAAHIHLALQEILARETDPMSPLVITVGSFHAGDTFNVIPDTAILEGSIRSFDAEQRAFVKKRVTELSQLTASAYRAGCDVEFIGGTAINTNDEGLVNELKGYLSTVPLKLVDTQPRLSSEDFSLISNAVPSAFLFLGAGGKDAVYHAGGSHNPKVVFNEDVMPYGSAAMAVCALNWLKNHR